MSTINLKLITKLIKISFMETFVFDGRSYAIQKESKLKERTAILGSKGVHLKLVSILVGNNPASRLYVNLKKKAGERVGIVVEVKEVNRNLEKNGLIKLIDNLNKDDGVNGIMVQLPLPKNYSDKDRNEIINSIDPRKDVDGLKDKSRFVHPTTKAILEILSIAMDKVESSKKVKVCIVGSTGMVGGSLVKVLKLLGYDLLEADLKTKGLSRLTKKSDVIISATGFSNLIKPQMVKWGVILIDVGSPVGDIDKKTYHKAFFVSPAPGGVGPVTIVSLLENLIDSYDRS